MRWPRGRLGTPMRSHVRLSRWALAVGASLCIVMPLLGASVPALWAGNALRERPTQPAPDLSA